MPSNQDPRITSYEFDAETDRKVTERLRQAGITKPEDLGSGRAFDPGILASELRGVDPEVAPLLAEKVIRDANWRQQAEGPEQPSVPEAPPIQAEPPQKPDRLADMQARLETAEREAQEWKRKYGERESKLGEERRNTAERLARLEQASMHGRPVAFTPAIQTGPMSYDPRILGDRDPNTPMTAAEVAALLQAAAMAWGAQLSAREQAILAAARDLRDFDLTTNEEADLLERHSWLANLDRPTQAKAMQELIKPLRQNASPATPAAPATPQRVDMLELARARNRQATTFIEPSSQGSAQERDAANPVDSVMAKKAAELREALNTPGGSVKAEALLNEMNQMRRRA